jgi:hypothetical protein
MGGPTSGNSDKPRKPPRNPKLTEDKLYWRKDNFTFYTDNTTLPAVFLVLGSRVQLRVDGAVDDSLPLSWKVLSQTSVELSLSISAIAKKLMPVCGQSYIFKVATFNKNGARSYKTSPPYDATGKGSY